MNPRPGPTAAGPALPLSKLRGVPAGARAALKRRGIATCARLLEAAGSRRARARLAEAAGIAPEVLDRIVRRADLARVRGIGAVFGEMLEAVGVADVAGLRSRDPRALHARLRRYNAEQRLARRAPTAEEVADWVAQARALPDLLGDQAGTRKKMSDTFFREKGV